MQQKQKVGRSDEYYNSLLVANLDPNTGSMRAYCRLIPLQLQKTAVTINKSQQQLQLHRCARPSARRQRYKYSTWKWTGSHVVGGMDCWPLTYQSRHPLQQQLALQLQHCHGGVFLHFHWRLHLLRPANPPRRGSLPETLPPT
jgi:hypothetical protein